MIGLAVIAVGVALVVVGCVLTFGLWTLIPAGAVLVIAGLAVPFDRVKEPQRAQRHQSAS